MTRKDREMTNMLSELILEDKAVELADSDDMAVILGSWWVVVK
jgi:hypothetical protein